MVKAPAFLFAEKEAMLRMNARMPFPASAKAWFFEGSKGESDVGDRKELKERERCSDESSPEREL